ncbi:hypothetical protein QO206_15200 [Leeuwenhoekiella aequorea]|uniref:hypothetical protein n=1 Tax=Leeuwenhoekiella aequorea TaxID=283736 RepID=UPI00352DC9A4
MVKKIRLLVLIIIISIILASTYGFLHNQVSYSISTEYFTKFKFEQFGFVEYGLETPRMTAGSIGIWATWWFGFLIGLINGVVGFFQPTDKIMWKSTLGATIRTLLIAIGIGILGIAVGYVTLTKYQIEWNVPSDVINHRSFMCAGTMHNFSYLGGLIGLIYGIKYQLKIKKASAQHRL